MAEDVGIHKIKAESMNIFFLLLLSHFRNCQVFGEIFVCLFVFFGGGGLSDVDFQNVTTETTICLWIYNMFLFCKNVFSFV